MKCTACCLGTGISDVRTNTHTEQSTACVQQFNKMLYNGIIAMSASLLSVSTLTWTVSSFCKLKKKKEMQDQIHGFCVAALCLLFDSSTNWTECVSFIPHITTPVVTHLFTHVCPTYLHNFTSLPRYLSFCHTLFFGWIVFPVGLVLSSIRA